MVPVWRTSFWAQRGPSPTYSVDSLLAYSAVCRHRLGYDSAPGRHQSEQWSVSMGMWLRSRPSGQTISRHDFSYPRTKSRRSNRLSRSVFFNTHGATIAIVCCPPPEIIHGLKITVIRACWGVPRGHQALLCDHSLQASFLDQGIR